jgi:hypothetical protein
MAQERVWRVYRDWPGSPGSGGEVGTVVASSKKHALRLARADYQTVVPGSHGMQKFVISVRAGAGIHSNPRRVRRNSTTLRNLALVKITRNRDGTVGIVARRNAPKRSKYSQAVLKRARYMKEFRKTKEYQRARARAGLQR